MRLAAGLRPDPLGELIVLPRPPTCVWGGAGPPEREREWEGKGKGGGEGKKGEGRKTGKRGKGGGRKGVCLFNFYRCRPTF